MEIKNNKIFRITEQEIKEYNQLYLNSSCLRDFKEKVALLLNLNVNSDLVHNICMGVINKYKYIKVIEKEI